HPWRRRRRPKVSNETVAIRTVTARNLAHLDNMLAADPRRHPHLGADGRSIGPGGQKLNLDPVVRRARGIVVERTSLVMIEKAITAVDRNEQVHEPVVIIVSPGAASIWSHVLDDHTGGNLRESAVSIVVIEQVVQSLSSANEQVQVAVVVVVGPS